MTKESRLKWTEKVLLSSRIQDPLGLYVLKFLERYFLEGITTQTQRLRYYSFLTWAWTIVEEKNFENNMVLKMEKVATLAAAYHHLSDRTPPNGIRNRRSAESFISAHSTVDINRFIDFGRDNRDGYGNYYYKGPLATLRVCARIGDNIITSAVGREIATAFEESMIGRTDLLLKEKLLKKDLAQLGPACFCGNSVTPKERRLWRKVFFGFAKPGENFKLQLDHEAYSLFKQGKITIPVITVERTLDIQDFLRDVDIEISSNGNTQEHFKKALARRASLFLIMRIFQKAQPTANPVELAQTIRDCIYFHQFERGQKIKTITFGPLVQCCELWESYVHNLYYINFIESLFEYLLENLKAHPMGVSVDQIISNINEAKVCEELSNIGLTIDKQNPNMNALEQDLRTKLKKERTTLKVCLNEKTAFLNIRNSESAEAKIANLCVLFVLLKYRFESFSTQQKTACEFNERLLYSIRPTVVYPSSNNLSLMGFLKHTLNLVSNRHRLISAIKYELDGTRSWLFTEEDGLLFYYGTNYQIRSYREAKWDNVTELLIDMGLVTISNATYCLSETGERWLDLIF